MTSPATMGNFDDTSAERTTAGSTPTTGITMKLYGAVVKRSAAVITISEDGEVRVFQSKDAKHVHATQLVTPAMLITDLGELYRLGGDVMSAEFAPALEAATQQALDVRK